MVYFKLYIKNDLQFPLPAFPVFACILIPYLAVAFILADIIKPGTGFFAYGGVVHTRVFHIPGGWDHDGFFSGQKTASCTIPAPIITDPVASRIVAG
jgi:hypothetical protein